MPLDAAEIEKRINDSYELPNSVSASAAAPLVTVRTYTYQHAPYIRECIEGVLAQKTSFPFEYIIGEDFSDDGTREIVFEYAQRYPEIIRVVTADYNVGGKANVRRCINRTRGKYVALCEGDDYWISPLKLQRQVEVMEANPDISFCFHNAFILNEQTRGALLYYPTPLKPTLNFAETLQLSTPTGSLLARADVLATLPAWRDQVIWQDLLFRLWCAHKGKLAYVDEVMSVYRIHTKGLTASALRSRQTTFANEIFLYEQLDKETNYAYTAVIQAQLQRIRANERHHRWGKLYYLLHPQKVIEEARRYTAVLRRLRSVIFYGQQVAPFRNTGL